VQQQHEDRRLITILAADVVGYSRLMAADESGTLAQLKAHRKELLEPKTAEHHGRVVKLMGDGTLMEFGSVVDAINFAIDVQKAMAERNSDVPEDRQIIYRVGINIGDIIVEGDDIYGDGVNIAARLEQLADPGGICVSRNVFNHIKNKLEVNFQDIGEQNLKNIPEAIRAYRIVMGSKDPGPAAVNRDEPLTLPDKPSIAVLPFTNMSGDPEQEFFADGMAEDIITNLSRYRWFFVIARNSSFTYKGLSVDIKQVARELGVRYVLEGSVRKAGNRVRVTAQLVDAVTGHHIWAERYDRELDDIFTLQDEITETIVAAIEPELGVVERDRSRRKAPDSLGAWDSYQRGLWHAFDDGSRDALGEAKRWFRSACEHDPDFAVAYAELAYTHVADIIRGLTNDPKASLEQAAQAAEKAVTLDPRDPVARFALGRVHIFRHAFDKAIAEMEAALAMNTNFDRAYYGLGMALMYGGRPEESIPQYETAIRLSPRSPILWAYLAMLGRAHFILKRYEEAVKWFEKAIEQPNTTFLPFVDAAAALGHLDRVNEARAMIAEVRKRKPDFSIDSVRTMYGQFGQYSEVNQIIEGLRKAELPE